MKRLILVIALFLSLPAWAADKEESTFDRVVRTHVLRCAYVLYPTFVDKDPNTGKMSGLFYDVTEEIGKQLGLKIEWGPELAVDTGFQGIGKNFDANCTGFSPIPQRTFAVGFSRPAIYMPYVMYVRADDNRFRTLEDFNSDKITIAALDGELSQTVAREQFPKAKTLDFAGMSSVAERLEAVIAGKADVAPMDAPVGADYMAKNPGKLKAFSIPLRVGTAALAIPHGEPDLKSMLDITIDVMVQTGALERILAKHTKYPGTYLLPAEGHK